MIGTKNSFSLFTVYRKHDEISDETFLMTAGGLDLVLQTSGFRPFMSNIGALPDENTKQILTDGSVNTRLSISPFQK